MPLYFLSTLFFLPAALICTPPTEVSQVNSLIEETESEMDIAQDSFFNEEEELSAIPQKGNRPQVIQIPNKTSSPR